MKKALLKKSILCTLATGLIYFQYGGALGNAASTTVTNSNNNLENSSTITDYVGDSTKPDLNMTWTTVSTTSPKLNVGSSRSMSFSNLNSLNFNTNFNSPTNNTDSILYANQNATININNVGDVNFGSNSQKLYVDQAVHAFGGKFIATDINNFNLNATGGGVLMAQNLNGSEALIKIEAKDDINITTNKEVKPNGSTNSAMAITSGSYYNGGKTEYNLSAKGNVNIIAPDSAVALYMNNWYYGTVMGNGDNIVSINGEEGVTIKGSNAIRLNREDTKSTSGNYIATITSTNGKVNLDTASTAILITNKNSVKNDKTEVNIDADSINISSKNGDAIDITNNATVNLNSAGDVAIFGGIKADDKSTVNLSANGDTSSSSGKYSISKNSQVNFNKGEWTVNNWSGDDTGSVTIGENAKVNINHQVAISNLDIKDGSTTVVNADKLGSDSAFKVSDKATVNIGNNSSLYVNGADLNQKYTIIDGYNGSARWDKVYTDNKLISYGQDISDGNLVLESQINDLNKVFKDNKVVISNAIQGSANTKAYDFFKTTANLQDEKMAANAINSVANMGELAGVNHVSYSTTNLMTNAVHTHLSKLNDTKQEDNLWAEYIHSKEKVDGMNLGGLDAKYNAIFNGIIVGSDLYNEGKTTAGMAFSYIDASIHGNTFSSYTKNDAQYYGLSLYGRIDNGDSAILGDISYMHSNNDITQKNTNNEITASPHSDTFTIGSSVEQYYNVGAGVLSPFAGLRYMHLGTGDYTNSLGMRYDVDEQNIWLLPIGVSYTAPYQKGDWNISPYAKASYIWAFGDTDTSQTVALNNNFDTFGFDVVDKDSFVGEIGLNVDSEKMGYSLSYGYQKGDNVQANKWSANVIFKF